ncbi:MAG TPA: AraC family transcriptional regulator [Puia sp.]|nr:AraC family transcriptional regulator [Puia sp.]
MVNLYESIKESSAFRKIEVNELLFAEYTCMNDETRMGIWSDKNYFAFIQSGKKMWKSIHQEYPVNQGEILFIKKGANLTHQFFDDEFCAIFIFIPDDFITSFLKKNFIGPKAPADLSGQDSVIRIPSNQLLSNYAQSIRSFLMLDDQPDELLLKLKFEELLLSLVTNRENRSLTDYFISLSENKEYRFTQVMEDNFAYNLSLEEYARLCHMSLSSFKRAFKNYYHSAPANWLKERRLELAHQKLINTNLAVNQVSFECGFEDVSHFIRVFKQKFNHTPFQYRQKYAAEVPVAV